MQLTSSVTRSLGMFLFCQPSSLAPSPKASLLPTKRSEATSSFSSSSSPRFATPSASSAASYSPSSPACRLRNSVLCQLSAAFSTSALCGEAARSPAQPRFSYPFAQQFEQSSGRRNFNRMAVRTAQAADDWPQDAKVSHSQAQKRAHFDRQTAAHHDEEEEHGHHHLDERRRKRVVRHSSTFVDQMEAREEAEEERDERGERRERKERTEEESYAHNHNHNHNHNLEDGNDRREEAAGEIGVENVTNTIYQVMRSILDNANGPKAALEGQLAQLAELETRAAELLPELYGKQIAKILRSLSWLADLRATPHAFLQQAEEQLLDNPAISFHHLARCGFYMSRFADVQVSPALLDSICRCFVAQPGALTPHTLTVLCSLLARCPHYAPEPQFLQALDGCLRDRCGECGNGEVIELLRSFSRFSVPFPSPKTLARFESHIVRCFWSTIQLVQILDHLAHIPTYSPDAKFLLFVQTIYSRRPEKSKVAFDATFSVAFKALMSRF